ncbi:MAG: PQQ-binding-like beta-propeller repeat protein [Planctomycetales bacterium]|nr:PQQ-binding-like beta-propeller repeat protein [Planctomycetales bacterium]
MSRTRAVSLVVGLLLSCGSAALRAGENWPQIHGPRGDGHSDSTGLPLTWSESKNVKWKTAIHDKGWSSPVIWGNQVWLTTATDKGEHSFVLCLDKTTGKVIHDLKLFDNENVDDIRKYNTYASPTCAIEDGRVYVHFGSYGTACLDTRTAKVLWTRRDLPCNHFRGPGSSPFLFGNMVYIHYDGFDHQYIVALDKQTGKTVWKKDRDVDYGTDNGDIMKAYCTPIVIEVGGKKQLISATSKAALALDPSTGEEFWRIRYPGFSVAARPLYSPALGLLFINTGFGKGEIHTVKPDGRGDLTDSVVWRNKRSMPSKPSSLLIGDLLFQVDDTGVPTCLEAKTGEVVWTGRLDGSYSSSPLFADGKIYFFNHDGLTSVIEAGRTFKLLATNKLDEGFMASPAVSGKALFLRTKTHLYRLEE